MVVVTVLSVAPGLLVMVTCFTRFVVALSFLRAGLGLQTTPANLILISLALFMTFYVMGPTFDRAWQNGVQPLMENADQRAGGLSPNHHAVPSLHARQCARQGSEVVRGPGARPKGLACGRPRKSQDAEQESNLRVLIPAFMISELRRGFEIGFLIVLPFLVIDMIVATLDDVDGHDDAAADRDIASLQDAVLRADRRLELADRRAGALICLTRTCALSRYQRFYA